MWSFKKINFSLFDKVKNFFKDLYFTYFIKPKQVKEDKDIRNQIIDDFVALYKVSPSDIMRLATFDLNDNDEKIRYHNKQLEEGRKHQKATKSPLLYEPEATEQKIFYYDDEARNITRTKAVDYQKTKKILGDKDKQLNRLQRLKDDKTNIKI